MKRGLNKERDLKKSWKSLLCDSFEITGKRTCVCDGEGYNFAKAELLDSEQYKVRVLTRHRKIKHHFIKGELHDET